MRIHAISTGMLRIKNNHRVGKGESRALRQLMWFLDPTFTEFFPIHVWVIEHPEGVIVIDTGDTARSLTPDYFPPGAGMVFRNYFRWLITPEDEIGPQLHRIGIAPEDVRWVVMTHAHMDHANGLNYFPNSEIIFSETEYHAALRDGTTHGAIPSRWPDWMKPSLINYLPEATGPFSHSYPLTKAGDVRIVPTPGHTIGHQSVIVQDGDVSLFFAGDTSFGIKSLLKSVVDGVAHDARTLRETQRLILDYAQHMPTVYLPTHDADSARRLQVRETLNIGQPIFA